MRRHAARLPSVPAAAAPAARTPRPRVQTEYVKPAAAPTRAVRQCQAKP